MDGKINAIIFFLIIANAVYADTKYRQLSKKVDNLSKLVSRLDGDVNYKLLKEHDLKDDDIEKILKLVENGGKLEAIKFLGEVKGLDHMEGYKISSQLFEEF